MKRLSMALGTRERHCERLVYDSNWEQELSVKEEGFELRSNGMETGISSRTSHEAEKILLLYQQTFN